MIIKNITIENFRSYYGENSIDIGDGLTLIIGGNGDGKTTFFEALEWLFDTVGNLPKVDTKYISKKKIAELLETEAASLKVSMTYVNEGSEKTVQKSFRFTKSISGEISTSNYAHEIYVQNGIEKDMKEGEQAIKIFDRDFAPSIRKYCLFKGEHELNIFNKEEAMSYLVETFSQIRDFDPYMIFMTEAKRMAELATDNAIKSDRKNTAAATRLRSLIREEEKRIGILETDLKDKLGEAVNFQTLLEDLEKNKEASTALHDINERLDTLKESKEQIQRSIRENYTFRLLDEMWILMGFQPIANEYREFVGKLDKNRRMLQSKYDQEVGKQKVVAQIQKELSEGRVPLAINIPDENTMREMLNDEFCKVCNRPAPKDSDAYNYMKMRLEKFLESQKEELEQEEVEPLFKNSFIRELNDRYSVLHNNMGFITHLDSYIDKAIRDNIKKHEEVSKYDTNIERDEERKKQILAHTDGLSEEQLMSAYQNISEWWKGRADAERQAERLQTNIDKHKETLERYQEEYAKISEESSAAMYGRTSQAIRKIMDSFISAKQRNKREFLNQLEAAANEYLEQLNKGDFRGYARILEKADNSAEIVLIDTDDTRIYNPNTALKTTMYMSLLFAVAKLTTIKHENDYPLIFDAPTSSFTPSKESYFFGVIAGIKKQTIIVTKSFLKDEDNEGNAELDLERLKEIDAKKYRIEKKRPFVEKDLSTIQTTVELI